MTPHKRFPPRLSQLCADEIGSGAAPLAGTAALAATSEVTTHAANTRNWTGGAELTISHEPEPPLGVPPRQSAEEVVTQQRRLPRSSVPSI